MAKVGIYPGTFDPITNGHLDVIKRALNVFDKVIVAIAVSENKNTMFDVKKRVMLTSKALESLENVEVIFFDGLLVNCCKEYGVKTIIRGLRAVSDFEYELQIGYANASLDSKIDTIYFMPSLQHAFISATVVRDILRHNGEVSHLVPGSIIGLLKS